MTSVKSVFVTLLAFCVTEVFIVYLFDIRITTSRFVDITYTKYNNWKLFGPSNKDIDLEEQSTIKWNYRESALFFVKNNFTLPVVSKLNNTFKNETANLFTATTTMTFNTSLIVQCKQSLYVQCIPPPVKPSLSTKVFNIVYLNRPEWQPMDLFKKKACPINECVISDGPVTQDTDLVVIYGVRLSDNFQSPKRWPNQTYIISVWEPPLHIRSEFLRNENSPWNDRINLIMSYRLDADIFVPYSKLIFSPKPVQQRPDYYKIAQSKIKTAVWMVSKCRTPSKRWEYVQEMRKYIDVDIFGNCGESCYGKGSRCKDWSTKYKFYLSFENSYCKDYVTEKYFKLFHQTFYVIPVVRGGVDYHKYFPDFTFIDAADFKTPKDLALHLKHLASDLQTYSKYLEYKDLYVRSRNIDQLCSLCSFVHTHKLPVSKTYNLKSWMDNRHCYNPTSV